MHDAQPPARSRLRAYLAVLAIAALTVSRVPALLTHPRFWAEEAVLYFRYAANSTWYDALTATQYGYYSLFNNAAALLSANLVPLEYAPFVTAYLALFIQLVPHVLIWFGSSPCWSTEGRKLLASLVVLFVAQDSEIWLNTINSQFHLCLITFLILIDESADARVPRNVACEALLVVSAFTGVVSCFLTPLFVYKALLRRRATYAVHALTLVAASCIHVAILVHSLTHNRIGGRFEGFSPGIFLSSLLGHVLGSTFLGSNNGGFLVSNYGGITTSLGGYETVACSLLVLSSAGLTWLLWRLGQSLPSEYRLYFVGSFVLVSVLSTLSSQHGRGGPRYAYATCVIFALLLLLQALDSRQRAGWRWLAAAAVAIAIPVGAHGYWFNYRHYSDDWPQWSREIAKWRADANHPIAVHPPGWELRLP